MLANCRLQFLLDRLGKWLKLFVSTDSTSCHEFASQFDLAICLCAKKHPRPRGNRVASTCVYLNDPATGHECQRNRRKEALTPSRLGAIEPERRRRCVCASMRACLCACASVCVRASACVMYLQYTRIIFHPG